MTITERIKNNVHFIVVGTLLFSMISMFNTCSSKRVLENNTQRIEEVSKQTYNMKLELEELQPQLVKEIQMEFTKNLINQSEIQNGKLKTEEIQKRFDNLNKSLNEIKNKK